MTKEQRSGTDDVAIKEARVHLENAVRSICDAVFQLKHVHARRFAGNQIATLNRATAILHGIIGMLALESLPKDAQSPHIQREMEARRDTRVELAPETIETRDDGTVVATFRNDGDRPAVGVAIIVPVPQVPPRNVFPKAVISGSPRKPRA